MKRSNWTAWLLIIAGGVLLLNHFQLFHLNRALGTILLAGFLAIVFFNRALHHPERKGILGGTFFFFVLLILLFMQFGQIPVNDRLGSGLILLALAFANFINYFVSRQKTSNIIYAVIFAVVGAPLIISYYQLLPNWKLEDLYTTYRPVILIIIGLAVLTDGFSRRSGRRIKRNEIHQ